MKTLKFEFFDVKVSDLIEFEKICCRVALNERVQVVGLSQSSEFCFEESSGNDVLHVVLQVGNIVIASQALVVAKVKVGNEEVVKFDTSVMKKSVFDGFDDELDAINLQVFTRVSLQEDLGVKETESYTQEVNVEENRKKYEGENDFSLNDEKKVKDLKLEKVLNDSYDLVTGSKSFRKVNDCEYLERIARIEENVRNGKEKIDYFKKVLGNDYQKVLFEAKCRESRSPTRSPARSRGSGLTTPQASQMSLNVSMISSVRDMDLIEIPGVLDVDIEKVSINHIDVLATCIAGLVIRNSSLKSSISQIIPITSALKNQETYSKIIENACKASIHESEIEYRNFDDQISKLKFENQSISSKIHHLQDRISLTTHEKQDLLKTLETLQSENIEILKNHSKSSLIQEITSLSEASEKLEHFRVQTEENLIQTIENSQEYLKTSSIDLDSLLQEKKSLKSSYSRSLLECERLESENLKLLKDFSILSKSSSVDLELNQILSNLKKMSVENFEATENLKKEVIRLRSEKLDTNSDSQNQLMMNEKDSRSLQSSGVSLQKNISFYQENINDLQKTLKPLKQDLNQIQEIFVKKEKIEESLENHLEKLKIMEKIALSVRVEVNYFSDFVFSFSQAVMQHQRITDRVKNVLESKNIEFGALKEALSEIKEKNPVYVPLEGDFLDQALAEYLNKRDSVVPVCFKRESYGVYFFGSKKIMIKVERDKIIVRTGGGLLPIEQFIDMYLVSEIDKQLRQGDENGFKNISDKFEAFKCDTPILEEDI
jgi:hypothetical protein